MGAEAAGGRPANCRGTPLFDDSSWDFDRLRRVYDAIERVACDDLGLDIYPNQIEIVSSEQMLDACAAIGLPLMYRHWSFGKHFVRHEAMVRRGLAGLAYEIVINSNPCISYQLEDNTMAMHTLVMAHAAFGHNHFFKHNNVFRQWTDATGILGYLQFARGFVADCEERHGLAAVEQVIDSAHAIMDQGIFRYPRHRPGRRYQQRKDKRRQDHLDRTRSDLWRTLPRRAADRPPDAAGRAARERRDRLKLPEENLLYFLEKNSPVLEPWQREILRIVRHIAQYFHAQKQTKIMNEGCATFVHYYIVNALFDQGWLTEGALLEIIHSHTAVVFQPDFDDPRYSGINPYALGFGMMQDIRRVCENPTPEDRAWRPDMAGCGDWRGVLKDAWKNYRDESFIRQFLSPHLIRKMRLFSLTDDADSPHYEVSAIHDERGYDMVRRRLAESCDPGLVDPDIQVADVDLRGDRRLHLQHTIRDRIRLDSATRDSVLRHIRHLWGYDVLLTGRDHDSGRILYEAGTARQPGEGKQTTGAANPAPGARDRRL